MPEGDRGSPTLVTRNDTWDVPGYSPSSLPLQVGTEPSGMLHHPCSSCAGAQYLSLVPTTTARCLHPHPKYQIKGILETENPLTQAKVSPHSSTIHTPWIWNNVPLKACQTLGWPIPKTRNIINKSSLLLSLFQPFFKYPCETTSLRHTWALLTSRHSSVLPHGHHSLPWEQESPLSLLEA